MKGTCTGPDLRALACQRHSGIPSERSSHIVCIGSGSVARDKKFRSLAFFARRVGAGGLRKTRVVFGFVAYSTLADRQS